MPSPPVTGSGVKIAEVVVHEVMSLQCKKMTSQKAAQFSSSKILVIIMGTINNFDYHSRLSL